MHLCGVKCMSFECHTREIWTLVCGDENHEDKAILPDCRGDLQTLVYQNAGCTLYSVCATSKKVTFPNKLIIR